MCLKPTDSSMPSALPELSLPVSSPSDLGTVMEVTMFSAPPSPQSGTRIEEGNYIYIYILYIDILSYIILYINYIYYIHTVLCFSQRGPKDILSVY